MTFTSSDTTRNHLTPRLILIPVDVDHTMKDSDINFKKGNPALMQLRGVWIYFRALTAAAAAAATAAPTSGSRFGFIDHVRPRVHVFLGRKAERAD